MIELNPSKLTMGYFPVTPTDLIESVTLKPTRTGATRKIEITLDTKSLSMHLTAETVKTSMGTGLKRNDDKSSREDRIMVNSITVKSERFTSSGMELLGKEFELLKRLAEQITSRCEMLHIHPYSAREHIAKLLDNGEIDNAAFCTLASDALAKNYQSDSIEALAWLLTDESFAKLTSDLALQGSAAKPTDRDKASLSYLRSLLFKVVEHKANYHHLSDDQLLAVCLKVSNSISPSALSPEETLRQVSNIVDDYAQLPVTQ